MGASHLMDSVGDSEKTQLRSCGSRQFQRLDGISRTLRSAIDDVLRELRPREQS